MTLKEHIQKWFCENGVTEAAAIEVKFKDGGSVTIASTDNPNLTRAMEEVEEVKVHQGGEAGRA